MGKKFLTFGQKIKVTDWLRANREKLLKDRPTFEKLSHDLSEMLEIQLSGQCLRRLLDGIELDWRPCGHGDGGKSKWTTLVNEVQSLGGLIDQHAGAITANNRCASSAHVRIEQLENRLSKLEIDLGVKYKTVVQQTLPLPKGT